MIYKGMTHRISIRRFKQNANIRESAEESSKLGND
jgi:hypothetical protein